VPGFRHLRGLVVALRVCACVGCAAHPGSCPELTPARHCGPQENNCAGQREQARGTRQQRGYDAEHDRLRLRWKPKVDRCTVHCHAAVCVMTSGRLILPGQPWDLGHTADRTAWTGPEHAVCNRSAGGKAAHIQ
jgi:hypothetical protein